MASCLGMYIEPNLIKYAKVSREKDNIRVESFGIKFYDRLGETIQQIINDTYSTNTPISINLSDEEYRYFYMFTLLKKNDLDKAIHTEFESICAEKGMNSNAIETRYALVNTLEDKEKVKVIHVASNKNAINTIEQPFGSYKISTISPIGVSIANVANLKPKENVLIVNMQQKTTVTTIVDQNVYEVETYEEGAGQVLDSINLKENSYSKAYEICKNSTIYTMEGKDLQIEENEYLDDIMPVLYKIITKLQNKLAISTIKFDKIYLTGILSVVNNVDLYFQEILKTDKCEILKPYFINNTAKINMKDYIEVNSAMALALQGLGYGIKEMNFKKTSLKDKLSSLTSSNTSKEKKSLLNTNINLPDFLKIDFKAALTSGERWLLRTAGGILALTIIYSGITIYLNNEIAKKNEEALTTKQNTKLQIAEVEVDINRVKTKTNEYIELSNNLKNTSAEIAENNRNRKIVPNLLSEIQFAIPQGVQLTSIENTTGKHVVINAQSQKYEQLGYFKAILQNQGILVRDTIVSSAGEKNGDLVKVTIEGDMP